MSDQNRLGEMIRLYRTVKGLSLRDIAPQIGVGYATMSRIENGKPFDADTLLKLWTWMLADHDTTEGRRKEIQKEIQKEADSGSNEQAVGGV